MSPSCPSRQQPWESQGKNKPCILACVHATCPLPCVQALVHHTDAQACTHDMPACTNVPATSTHRCARPPAHTSVGTDAQHACQQVHTNVPAHPHNEGLCARLRG